MENQTQFVEFDNTKLRMMPPTNKSFQHRSTACWSITCQTGLTNGMGILLKGCRLLSQLQQGNTGWAHSSLLLLISINLTDRKQNETKI